jgi:hypothetical protein
VYSALPAVTSSCTSANVAAATAVHTRKCLLHHAEFTVIRIILSATYLLLALALLLSPHRYAANVLTFPSGDWYGNVHSIDDARAIVAATAAIATTAAAANTASTHGSSIHSTSLLPPQGRAALLWRGRLGLDKEQQLQLGASAIAALGSDSTDKSAAAATACAADAVCATCGEQQRHAGPT